MCCGPWICKELNMTELTEEIQNVTQYGHLTNFIFQSLAISSLWEAIHSLSAY